jgi:tRNA modification GTPase
MSGEGSHAVAARVLQPFTASSPRRIFRSIIVHPSSGERLDDVLYTVFFAPHSYTGQDVVEISCHGGMLVPTEVLQALLAAGARLALPGEFTRRALLAGKMDLLQAEAVGDLIDATAPAQRRAALHQMDRGLTRRIEELRKKVLDLETLVCYEIDFPEEDSGPVPQERIWQAVADLRGACEVLLATSVEGERLREGAVLVIAGLPNTGKSSLFNALLGTERAIVTEHAGTTRDAIEALLTCDGFPIRLVDTAGLRATTDVVEQKGIEVSHRYLAGADAVLFCSEAGRGLDAIERDFLEKLTAPSIVVRTKIDLAKYTASGIDLGVSVQTGEGLATLRAEIARLAFAELAGATNPEPLLTRARHRVSLEQCLEEIVAFSDARRANIEAAVAAVHLRAAITKLESVIGVVTTDDILEAVFSRFCIGK